MKELRIGIIGTGMISNRHMTVWSNIPGAKVVAGCDIEGLGRAVWHTGGEPVCGLPGNAEAGRFGRH